MLGKQVLRQIVADHFFTQAYLLHEGGERLCAEFAVQAARAGNFADFGINQPLADRNAVFVPEYRERVTVDKLLQRRIHAAALDKLRHIERRIVLPLGFQPVVERVVELAKADVPVADLCHIAAAQTAKCVRSGDVTQGKGECDHRDEGQRNDRSPARVYERTNECDHGTAKSCGLETSSGWQPL